MERNILLTIAYDGSVFCGWQRQPDVRTVQGHLEHVMTRLFNRKIILNGTSRTDAGVHALAQRASFKTDIGIPVEKIAQVVNNALCAAEGRDSRRGGFAKSPVRITEAEEVPSDFHARFDCRSKKYIYRICCGVPKSGSVRFFEDTPIGSGDFSLVFERNYAYHVSCSLDTDAMKKAARYMTGTHDFRSFEASGGNPRETTVRTVFEAAADEKSINEIFFTVRGDGFLYNMVRIMAGTLVEVGQGKRCPEEVVDIIKAKDRTKAGHTAPPQGLYLAEVYYR